MPGPVIRNIIPEWFRPEAAKNNPPQEWLRPDGQPVDADYWTRVLRRIGTLTGANDPQQVMAIAGAMTVPGGEASPVQAGINYLEQKFPKLAGYIKAYHGSPHDFDKFSLEKIGTGEGAQAYGHGLYFAENPTVAREYRDSLAPAQPVLDQIPLGPTAQRTGGVVGGVKNDAIQQLIASGKLTAEEADALHFVHGDIDDTIKTMRYNAQMRRDQGGFLRDGAPLWDQRADLLERLKPRLGVQPSGKMYEVSINAHPDAFLDWDKPLSQQKDVAEAIARKFDKGGTLGYQRDMSGYGDSFEPRSLMRWEPDQRTDMQALNRLRDTFNAAEQAYRKSGFKRELQPAYEAAETAWMTGIDKIQQTSGRFVVDPTKTGADLYKAVAESSGGRERGPEAASKALKEQFGIPGIKYLDQGSRATGEGTRNFVVFDDSLIDIMRKYGVVLPLGAGLAALSQQQQKAAK